MADNVAGFQAENETLKQQLSQLQEQTASSSKYDTYQTSLTARYCSPEMSKLFSQRSRHSTWRKLWLYLADSEKELGIETITEEALEQMMQKLEVSDEDFEVARVEEKRRRHDVMAHVHAFGVDAPAASGIIHYGVCTLIYYSYPFPSPLSDDAFDFASFKRCFHLPPETMLLLSRCNRKDMTADSVLLNRRPAATSPTTQSSYSCAMQWTYSSPN